ncbi:MAG: hypothetical protein JXD18_07880 [Anaerolineae bacterium]|nr:hypothetical protein [Anaerolineae bacterium]
MSNKRQQARTDEVLSAYIDGALNGREQHSVTTRLAGDPELQEQLTRLRQTIALVREMPQVEAPRNFLLTPAMVGEAPARPRPRRAPARWLAPALSFATAVSALLLVVTLSGGILGANLLSPAPVVVSTEALEVAEAPVEERVAPADAPTEVGVFALEAPGPTDEGSEESDAVEEETALAVAVATTATLGIEGTPIPPAAGYGGGGALPTATPAAVSEYAEDASPAPPVEPEGGARVGGPGVEETGSADGVQEGGEAGDAGAPVPLPQPEEPAPTRGRPWLLTGALALLTLALVAATLVTWRARR